MSSAVVAFMLLEEESCEKVKRKILKDRSNPFELPETDYIAYYRINKEAFRMELDTIEGRLTGSKVLPVLQLAATLRLLAEGSYQRLVGKDSSMSADSITLNNVPVPLSKYNLRRQIRRDSTNQGNTHSDKGKVIAIEVHDQPRSSTDTICSRPELEENVTNTDLHMSNMSASVTTMSSAMEESSTKIISNNPTAMIALQQLASISSVQSLERIMPTIRKNLLVNTENLYANRPGKLPRQSSKRVSQFETNRCPLCSRVYRSQAFLNEHMRQEHSVLI